VGFGLGGFLGWSVSDWWFWGDLLGWFGFAGLGRVGGEEGAQTEVYATPVFVAESFKALLLLTLGVHFIVWGDYGFGYYDFECGLGC